MPKRRDEAQEFIFGEEGGRGTPAQAYFRKISNSAPSASSKPNSLGLTRPDNGELVGAGRSHAEQHVVAAAGLKKHKQKKKPSADSSRRPSAASIAEEHSYFDLDDDWDSTFDSTPHPHVLRSVQVSKKPSSLDAQSEVAARAERDMLNSQVSRILRFKTALRMETVDIEQLRNLSWSGIPADLRPQTWMHLLGYLPPTAERRHHTLQKKRAEYVSSIEQVFGTPDSLDQAMWHQISIDVPRTNPHILLYSYPATQRSLERILYLWAIRHPASGYVQGINDLLTPFFQTFLTEYVGTSPVEDLDPALLSREQLDCVEADSYWCLTKLLDGIQDNYIHAQPGIHRQVALLEKLTTKIDAQLVQHLHAEGVGFMQFSFRWMNCLLMREVPMNCAIRIFDTYLAEGPSVFSTFHVYVCAAFLAQWSKELKQMDFQDLMIFLQSLPTKAWAEKDMELVLSSAFMYQTLYRDVLK